MICEEMGHFSSGTKMLEGSTRNAEMKIQYYKL